MTSHRSGSGARTRAEASRILQRVADNDEDDATTPTSLTECRSNNEPYGLLLRQLQQSRLRQWQSVDDLELDDRSILKDPHVLAAVEKIQNAAWCDLTAVLKAAGELWKLASQRGDEYDTLQEAYDELEVERKNQETKIQGLEKALEASSAAWKCKFSAVASELEDKELQWDKLRRTDNIPSLNCSPQSVDDSTLQNELLGIKLQVNELQRERDELADKVYFQASEHSKAIEWLEEELKEFENRLSKVNSLLEEERKVNIELKSREKTLTQDLTEAKEEISDLRTKLADDSNIIKKLTETIYHMRKENIDFNGVSLKTELAEMPVVGDGRADGPVNDPAEVPVNDPAEGPVNDPADGPVDDPADGATTADISAMASKPNIHIHIHQHFHKHEHSHNHIHEHYDSDIKLISSDSRGVGYGCMSNNNTLKTIKTKIDDGNIASLFVKRF